MSAVSEKGHAKNVANFESLIIFCESKGPLYKPSNALLELDKLKSQWETAKTAIADARISFTEKDRTVNKRVQVFKPLKKLATKLISALDATEAAPETVADAKGFNRKIQGQRAEKEQKKKTTPVSETPEEDTNSASQQSFDNLIEHFSKLVELLKAEDKFQPNEQELQVETNAALIAAMVKANSDAKKDLATWKNHLAHRNKVLYTPFTGLCDTGNDVKKYLKSLFGINTQEYKQVSKITFRMYKD